MSYAKERDAIYNLIHKLNEDFKYDIRYSGFPSPKLTSDLWARVSVNVSSTNKTSLSGENSGAYTSKGLLNVEVFFSRGSALNTKAYAFAEEIAKMLREYKYKTNLWFSQVTVTDSLPEPAYERIVVTSRFNYNFRF